MINLKYRDGELQQVYCQFCVRLWRSEMETFCVEHLGAHTPRHSSFIQK